jgi:cytochrome P450
LNSGGGDALLDEPGVVDNEDPIVLAELAGDVLLQVVADVVGVPLRSGEQVLQAVRGSVTCLLGQLPVVLSNHRGEQAAYAVAHAAA